MDLNEKEKRFELRKQLLFIEEERENGTSGIPAKSVSQKLREKIMKNRCSSEKIHRGHPWKESRV